MRSRRFSLHPATIAAVALIVVGALVLIATRSAPSSGFVAGPRFRDARLPVNAPNPAPQANVNPQIPEFPHFPPAPKAKHVELPSSDKAPVISQVPTDQPVAFITIDDGYVRRQNMPDLLAATGAPATAFLISSVVSADPNLFRTMQRQSGLRIQNHTVDHVVLQGLSYSKQRYEICGARDELTKMFGAPPTLLRPPNGVYDDNTLRAAHDCGMSAVVLWRESTINGSVIYSTSEKTVRPGDIMLMHFQDSFAADLEATLEAMKAAGLTPALLPDYIG